MSYPTKIFIKFFLLIFTLTNLLSCSNNNSQPIDYKDNYSIEKGGILVNAMVGEPSNLIAMIAGDSASSAIAGNIFNSLIKYDEKLNHAPELAKKWVISPDQKTITFTLKDNLVWLTEPLLQVRMYYLPGN